MPHKDKESHNEYNRKYAAEHREKMREYYRRYRAEHREQIRENERRYRKKKQENDPWYIEYEKRKEEIFKNARKHPLYGA